MTFTLIQPFKLIFSKSPLGRTGKLTRGGILVYVKDGISCSRRPEHKNIKCIWIEIKQVKSKSFHVCKIYRPPHSTVQWNPIFEVCMENVLKEEKELYLMGDFNRDLLNVQIKIHGLTIRNLLV